MQRRLDEDGEWSIHCAQVSGEFRRYEDVDGYRMVVFTDGKDFFACLPQNVEVIG